MIKVFLFLFFSMVFPCQAAINVVQGPFSLDETSNLTVSFIKEADESISFITQSGLKTESIDSYQVYDGVPEVETVFFTPIDKIKNVIVLVSWDETNINAKHYKIFAYKYYNGKVSVNNKVLNDGNLSGYDGYNSSGLIFNYKNAESIRGYLKKYY
ncbi:hypothetical protein [Yersinia mollaretii]|uniref:Uncharacterized protein n=1 Tax=Yersinia mollaretii TaxID=33060 RepID=A0AA36PMS2_YERMO|nr:hypothetical protein [Yersinia mollaretii]MDA5525626.1 hypothetical protein [Yersinia mollaretii]MDR7871727.1 hypothetical protein [Yersinia mollaretii]PHZ29804.1 hypothetical protein CS537_20700 [Yersinia mollaretii]WQC73723.1 hypothetical protein U1Z61_14890 [Yersinia mollaretii]CNE05962.1 Uncharacterised protein [Yersinia mollaretii]